MSKAGRRRMVNILQRILNEIANWADILTLPFEFPQVFDGESIATQHGAAAVPPVHRYPEAQQEFPQQGVSYEQHLPLGQRRVKFGHPWRRNRLNRGLKPGCTGRTALIKGWPSGFVSTMSRCRAGVAVVKGEKASRNEAARRRYIFGRLGRMTLELYYYFKPRCESTLLYMSSPSMVAQPWEQQSLLSSREQSNGCQKQCSGAESILHIVE